MRKRKGFKLREVLGLLVFVSVFLTAFVSGYFAWKTNKDSLTEGYLESNYQYAKKLSSNTSELLKIMRNNIDSIAEMAGNKPLTQKELDIWYKSNEQYFNSIFIVDASRKVQAVSSNLKGIVIGTQLTSYASQQAVELRRHLISEPYVGATGRLIIQISSPIMNVKGNYLGYVGGTIYLEESNVLSRQLIEHFYGNGSYVYVADIHGHLIFHPDKERLRETITDNEVINRAVAGHSGSQKIINSKGDSYFAGYAYESISGWGIVAQTPTSILDEPIKKLIFNILMQSLPLFIIILLAAGYVSFIITKPLYVLAKFSEEAILSNKAIRSKIPKTSSHIYEVRQLTHNINNHLSLLKKEIQLDGLTGLANRKTFDLTINEWMEDHLTFSLILLDIDHFKKVNDEFGHLVGDEVLKYLAAKLREFSRDEDLSFRYGGEEFGVLVRFGNIRDAARKADHLRKEIAQTISPIGKPIFVSIGVSHFDGRGNGVKEIIERADKALYQSKAEGRNRTTVCYGDSDQ